MYRELGASRRLHASLLSLAMSLLPAVGWAEMKSVEMTSLRVVEKPDIKMITGRGQATLAVSVMVRNVGDTTAEGVQVSARLPSGETLQLKGASKLERNQKETFSGQQQKVLVNPTKVRVDATCRNCR